MLIMVAVFAGFIFTHDIMIKQIGFALAIGILIDVFVIRMMLVPAVMSLFGDKLSTVEMAGQDSAEP